MDVLIRCICLSSGGKNDGGADARERTGRCNDHICGKHSTICKKSDRYNNILKKGLKKQKLCGILSLGV